MDLIFRLGGSCESFCTHTPANRFVLFEFLPQLMGSISRESRKKNNRAQTRENVQLRSGSAESATAVCQQRTMDQRCDTPNFPLVRSTETNGSRATCQTILMSMAFRSKRTPAKKKRQSASFYSKCLYLLVAQCFEFEIPETKSSRKKMVLPPLSVPVSFLKRNERERKRESVLGPSVFLSGCLSNPVRRIIGQKKTSKRRMSNEFLSLLFFFFSTRLVPYKIIRA